nr:hypothetical protein [Tanacetum cinerariifolium]
MRVATQESQGGMRFKDNDLKIKIQAHRRANNESKEFPRTQGSKFQEWLSDVLSSVYEGYHTPFHVKGSIHSKEEQGATPSKPKASVRRTRSSSDTSITPLIAAAGPRLTTSQKGKQAAKASKAKNEGTGSIPGVLNVPTDKSEEELSWNSTDDEGADDEGKDGDGDEEDEGDDGEEGDGNDDDDGEEGNDDDDDQEVERDDEEEGEDDDQEYDDEEYDEETRDRESFDPILKSPKNSDDEGNGDEDLGLNVGREEEHIKEEEEEEDELYRDVNINKGRGIQATLKVEDSHVTLTPVNPDGQQQSSSVSSQFVTSMLNPTLDVGMESIFETTSQMDVPTPTSTSYAVAVDLSKMELKKILIEKMEGNKSIQRSDEKRNLYKALVEAYESDKIILDTYGETVMLKRRHDDDADKDEEPSAGPDRGSKRRREGKEPESASAPMETATRSAEFNTCVEDQPIIQSSQHPEWFSQQQKPPSPDCDWNKNLKVDALTPELLAGPTYELMKGSCKSLVELEYHLEEVFKATTDQLDWVNPEGQQYPHNLLKPIPLIPNSQGRHVIPFENFINNDLEYLRGGASSRKYTTSITKTKASDYGHIKWIEDLVPRTMWIEEPICYDKHTLWGVSHWGRKRQQFYGFAVNRESARYMYSKRRINAVTEIKIVEWHSYKHLDWITVRRDDDKLYKFKEGDFKRLRI